nr:transposase [Actinomycetota bacterium]
MRLVEGLIGPRRRASAGCRRREELVGSLQNKPGLRRYLRRTPGGLLRIDSAAIKAEAHLD